MLDVPTNPVTSTLNGDMQLLATLLYGSLISSALVRSFGSTCQMLRAATGPAEGGEINQGSSDTQALEIVQEGRICYYVQEHLPSGFGQEGASCLEATRKVLIH
jgi:hypothetical protein